LDGSEFKFCLLDNNVIYIRSNFKKKGKEYGIITLNVKQINALAECIDLQSVAPLLTPKFSQRLEKFLLPRFDEIIRILYSIKPPPNELGIEISKENLNDILKGLKFANVITGLKNKGHSVEELTLLLKKVKFEKTQ
jgi:hypothetical protein